MWNQPIKTYISNKGSSLDKKIGEYLINLDNKIFKTNSVAVAKEIGCSPSAVTKFLHKCGFEGWKTYTTFAYISLNRNVNHNESDLSIGKREIFRYIEQVKGKVLNSIVKKIEKSKKIIISGHGSTKDYLKLFGRNLRVIGKNIEIIDISDKYYRYENKYNTVIIVVSFSGKNSNILNIAQKLKKNNLATKIFISPSEYNQDIFDYNLTINSNKLLFSTIEAAIPLIKISYVQHCFDIILSKMLNNNPKEIMNIIDNIGLSKRIDNKK